ncbi:hypothetical protein BC833DRAFT_576368 [Globomyces pollinis-pini]|nr:hypothetical protein BC833DRAFT_576368 [Globomyces pollinis-pini]
MDNIPQLSIDITPTFELDLPPPISGRPERQQLRPEALLSAKRIDVNQGSRRTSIRKEKKDTKPAPKIFSLEQRKEFEEIFSLFDTDGSGTMEIKEFKVVLWAMGFQLQDNEAENMIAKFFKLTLAEASDIQLSKADFVKIMLEELGRKDTTESLKVAFELYDVDRKGYIVLKDIKRVCKEVDEPVTDHELELMMSHIDKSGDGSVTLDEWITVMSDY